MISAPRHVRAARVSFTLMLAALAALLLPSRAEAAGEAPIEQGFPFDCIAYGEVNFRGGISALTDYDAFEKAGAIGMGYADQVETLAGPFRWGEDRPISGDDLRATLRGIRRIGGAVIDVTASGVSWLVAVDHDDAAGVIAVMQAAASKKAVRFEAKHKFEGTQIYTMQFPENWLSDWIRVFTNPRAMFGWGGIGIESYTDPIYIAEWGGRFLLFASSESELMDAFEFYDSDSEIGSTLAGSRAFTDARKDTAGKDVMVYWNLESFFKKLGRMRGAGGSEMEEFMGSIESVLESKQFRAFVFDANYDPKTGWLDASARLTFFNRPAWIGVLPFDPKPTPLTTFCPQKPVFFGSLALDEPSKVYRDVMAMLKTKFEAMGSPRQFERMNEQIAKFAKENGFGIEDMISQFGNEHAVFGLSPYETPGIKRRGAGIAGVLRVRDQAAATEFLREKLLKAANMRDLFHTNDLSFVEIAGSEGAVRVPYWTFSIDDTSSFSYLFLDGCFIFGNQDAVRASVIAHKSGTNLGSDSRYLEVEKRLPAKGLLTVYTDLSFMTEHATVIFPQGRESEYKSYNSWDMDYSNSDEVKPVADEPDETTLACKIFTDHLVNMRAGAKLVLRGTTIEIALTGAGLPDAPGFAALWTTIAKHNNWRQSRTKLKNQVGPAIHSYLFEHGTLPKDLAEFAKQSDARVLTDPSLAGASVTKPTEQHSYVWLGDHGTRDLTPAVPVARTRNAGENNMFLLLMSDGSVHRVTQENLDKALEAAKDPAAEPAYKSPAPQTLKQLLPRLKNKE